MKISFKKTNTNQYSFIVHFIRCYTVLDMAYGTLQGEARELGRETPLEPLCFSRAQNPLSLIG